MKTIFCQYCHQGKKVSPSRVKDINYCSTTCYHANTIGRPSPMNTRQQLLCLWCQSTFIVRQYRLKTAKFCSTKCKIKAQDRGISSANEKARKSVAYKKWRTTVFERDNYTCQKCGIRSGYGRAIILHADHIKPFALFPEARFDVSNGRTLCIDCHKLTNTYGRVGMFRQLLKPRRKLWL